MCLVPGGDAVRIGETCTEQYVHRMCIACASHLQVHCVPAAWAEAVSGPPGVIWDDSGLGGRPGSLWAVGDGALRLLMAVQGHRPPEDGLQLRSKEFALDAFPFLSEDAPPPPPPPPPEGE